MPPVPRSQTTDEVAGTRVDADLARLYAALDAQQAASDRAAAAQAAQIQGLTQAEANMLRGVGPAVDQTYKGAADDTSAYAKAYAMGMRASEEKAQAEANRLLQQNNAPAGQMLQPSGADQVLYGTEGYIPASTLRTQGAAFSSAAHMLPQTAFGRGRLSLQAAQTDAAERQRQLSDRRFEIDAQRPSLMSAELDRIRNKNFEREQFAETKRQNRANAKIQWESVKTSREYFGLDKGKTLAAEAAFMTDMTGELHVVRKGRVVPTGKLAQGSDAYGQVASANAAAAKGKPTKAQALTNRSNALKSTAGIVRGEAKDWLGTPIENPKAGSLLNPGKYVDKAGKGTNDPAKAARENALTWDQAISRAMQLEEVQQLISRFNLSPKAARAKVKAWLRATGFRPPATRPNPRRQGRTSQPKRYGPGGLPRG